MTDAALETLLLPFVLGEVQWPQTVGAARTENILFLRARAGAALEAVPRHALVCEQSFKPYADVLARAGYVLTEQLADEAVWPVVLLLPPRQREESRALLARAVRCAQAGGLIVASQLNTEGARSAEADLQSLLGPVHCLSKNKCRVFWARLDLQQLNQSLLMEWSALDAPRPIADGRFMSRPGLFAWDHIDAASALLVQHLPDDLSGSGADLGAGFGYLSAEVLRRNPQVQRLDLYEAEARALALARLNLAKASQAQFFWHDVATGLAGQPRYQFIVSNPPFHQGRADLPGLGQAFIRAAAAALLAGGRFWLVANRHLPYEDELRKCFRQQVLVTTEQGFKVIEAIK